jgi:hypothetical protein
VQVPFPLLAIVIALAIGVSEERMEFERDHD